MSNNLKMIREGHNLTQSELSERSGISRQTIINIEKGDEKDVKVSTLKRLSEALQTPISEIFP